MIDSNQDGQISIDDLYALVGVVSDLQEDEVEEIWSDIPKDNPDTCSYEEACVSAIDSSWMCVDDYDHLKRYVAFKDEWLKYSTQYDTDSDGKFSEDELRAAFSS